MRIIRLDASGHTETVVETADAAIAEVERLMNDPAIRGQYGLLVEDPPGSDSIPLKIGQSYMVGVPEPSRQFDLTESDEQKIRRYSRG